MPGAGIDAGETREVQTKVPKVQLPQRLRRLLGL
jgi:hypothetical protein